MSPNLVAFLDMIAWSEGTSTVSGSDNGYNVLVGRGLFHSYLDHPRKRIWVDKIKDYSTAAGRYQILARFFDSYRKLLRLDDKMIYPDGAFSPKAQDAIAVQYIQECHALEDIEGGNFSSAVTKCRSRWASFPGANYSQHENELAALQRIYIQSGGTIV